MNYDIDMEIKVLCKVIDKVECWIEGTHVIIILEPKPFHENKSAKDLEDFIWAIEQYFIATHTTDA